MRIAIVGFLLCLMISTSAFATEEGSILILKGEKAFAQTDAESTPLPFHVAKVIEGNTGQIQTGLRYLGISEDDGKQYGVQSGLHIFDAQGKAIAFNDFAEADRINDVRLSADKQPVLAVFSSTWLIGTWSFFYLSDMKSLGYIDALSDVPLVWADDKGVIISSMDTDDTLSRPCEYDPCGPVSVQYYSFRDSVATTVFAGTGECDYLLTDYVEDGDKIKIEKLCLDSPEAWATYPEKDAPRDIITLRVPSYPNG